MLKELAFQKFLAIVSSGSVSLFAFVLWNLKTHVLNQEGLCFYLPATISVTPVKLTGRKGLESFSQGGNRDVRAVTVTVAVAFPGGNVPHRFRDVGSSALTTHS